MKRLLLVVMIFSVYSVFCLHMSASSSLASAGRLSYQHDDSEALLVGQAAHEEGIEPESFDDDLGFLDEEEDEEILDIADPLFYWNTAMYHFNDKFYLWVLEPVARGYKRVVPETARTGVKNFFYNLAFPIRFVGCVLQGKGSAAVGELGRFSMNSVAGIAGFMNVVKDKPELNPPEEDVGQAFGRWGIGNGFYIVWPFLGPSTLRDSVGLVGDYFLDPITYVNPSLASVGIRVYDVVNKTSFRIGDYESLKEGAIDPYLAIRDAYIQYRKKQVDE